MEVQEAYELVGVERLDNHSAVARFTRRSDGVEVTIEVYTPRTPDVLSYERAKALAWDKLDKWANAQPA